MAKEYFWDVTIDGEPHQLYCSFTGNKYVLYVDDDHIANVYRKSVATMWHGMEEPVTICGKECLFLVWDEKPDFVIDGRLIGKNIDYEKALKKKNNSLFTAYRIVFGAGLLLLTLLVVLICMRWVTFDLHDLIICVGVGIWMTVWGGKNMIQRPHA
jgi:hypothetical protein